MKGDMKQRPAVRPAPVTRVLELRIRLPQQWPAAKQRQLVMAVGRGVRAGVRRVPRWARAGLVLVVLALMAGAVWWQYGGGAKPKPRPQAGTGTQAGQGVSAPAIPTNQQPGFTTLVPAGKSIDQLGGWAKVSPEGSSPVYAYVDHIDGVKVNVSQQELPASLKADTDKGLKELAAQFTANEQVVVGDIVAYVGTSMHGPQSVVMAKAGLLVLIKSTHKLTTTQWANYLDSLQ